MISARQPIPLPSPPPITHAPHERNCVDSLLFVFVQGWMLNGEGGQRAGDILGNWGDLEKVMFYAQEDENELRHGPVLTNLAS